MRCPNCSKQLIVGGASEYKDEQTGESDLPFAPTAVVVLSTLRCLPQTQTIIFLKH